MTAKVIAQYQNGNCQVTLYADGTKTREWPDGEEPKPAFPESIDLKITDWCDAGCAWCHEQSTRNGIDAPLATILRLLDGLPPGVELAIGGGHPMAHGSFGELLHEIKKRGLIANVTVNQHHVITEDPVVSVISSLQARQEAGLIHGIGISSLNLATAAGLSQRLRNLVAHHIVGVSSVGEMLKQLDLVRQTGGAAREVHGRMQGLAGAPVKVLVLGYKDYGFGPRYRQRIPEVKDFIADWRDRIGQLMRHPAARFSFDNLALEQLNVRHWVKPEVWQRRYMGDDGKFTMYVDAVKLAYAASSALPRRTLFGQPSLQAAFQTMTSVAT